MTTNRGQVSGFDVNKRKGRFSFVSNGNRCIWAELSQTQNSGDGGFSFWGSFTPVSFLVDSPLPNSSPRWWAGGACSSAVSVPLPSPSRLFLLLLENGFVYVRALREGVAGVLKRALLDSVTAFVPARGDFRSGEILLTHQYLHLTPETSSKGIANQFNSTQFNS